MKVAIIDVGSNSVRLLVASVEDGGVKELQRERVYLRLGHDAYVLGGISPQKLVEAEDVSAGFARVARRAGAERLETVVTAPGRQAANGAELVRRLSAATRASVVQLSAADEARLAWEGAVSRLGGPSGFVAVVDLGGGSCELAVGRSTGGGPTWVRSLDLGALRVTRAFLGEDRPPAPRVARARREIRRLVEGLDPPPHERALAVGGTARAVARIAGNRIGAERLDELARKLARSRAKTLTKRHGITPERAETLLGGTLVLAEVARRLGADLEVASGGLREGAALALARAEAAAA